MLRVTTSYNSGFGTIMRARGVVKYNTCREKSDGGGEAPKRYVILFHFINFVR